ncbi:hypothetical protein [Micromonospora costi]|uniref:Uncharacterized protein n=1 Tax=Micromonospora costi TaxID=1530042 RepID=A0A3B0A5R3_9ACTN|nr:hypothetical protein [Micromonospora costi]RKN55955.1 hypothetical protein D7193_15325 [Micromonospora costi]
MGVPLAEAFVRVRADTRDFKRDTERDASQSGDRAGNSFAGAFGRTLAGKAAGLFARFRRQAEASTDGAGATAGARFGSEFVRDAVGRLRDGRGRFVSEGAAAGAGFGDAFVRDASGRLRDARGRFTAEGRASGDGFANAFGPGVASSISRVSALIAVGVALGPAIIPVAAAAAAAVAGIGTAAIAAFAGLGVGVLAFMGVADAVKAMGAAEDAAADNAAALSRAHSAVEAAADGVRQAEQSLARTREQAAASNEQAARRVAESERDLSRALKDQLRVAQELNEAREEAKRRLDDLNQSLAENTLSQRQATLDVAEAKAELDKVLADPKATEAQREQARITYERNVLQLADLQRRGKELADDTAKANKAGVEGSREVQAARERIADADERVRASQQALTDARREQARAERDGIYQIQQAQQQLISAQRSLRDATVASGTAGAAAMDKLRQSLEGLSPAGQRFAKFLFGLKDEVQRIRAAAQEGLLPGAQEAIENLLPYLPQVERFVGGIAGRLGDMAVRASKALTGPFWRSFFGMIDKTAGPALDGMFEATGNIAEGFAAILQAFMPLNRDMGKGLVGLTASFADWAKGLSGSKGFQEFVDYVREYGPPALRFLWDLLKVGGKLLVSLAPLGAVLVTGLGKLADILASLDPGVLLAITAGIAALIAVSIGPLSAAIIAIVAAAGGIYYLLNRFGLLKPLIAGVTAAVQWAWQNVLQPTFAAIASFVMEQVVPAVMWLWHNAIGPAFQGIAAAGQWLWNTVLLPVFSALRAYVVDFVAPMFLWWYREVIKPVFERFALAAQVAWTLVKVVFGLMQIYVKTVLAPLWRWLYDNVIKPVWNGIKDTITRIWTMYIRPLFETFGGFIKNHVAPAFEAGVKAIGKAWEKIRDLTKIPVRFVVETVINSAIIGTYNKLAGVFGVDKVDKVALPKGFARGGVLPGYTPGKDVHRFYSPTAGAIDLSGGEAIIRPEGTRALGAGWVDAVNRAARSGGVAGVRRFLGGYADGGILDRLGKAASWAKQKAGDAISGVTDLFTDPAGTLRKIADKVIGLVPGRDTAFGRFAIGMPRKVADAAVDKVKSWFRGGEDGGPGVTGSSPLGGSAGMMRILRAAFPGLPLLSGFRPGSITLTGNRSYHSTNRAVDVPPIRAVAEWIFKHFRSITRELITPWQEFNLHNGRSHRYTGAVWNQHNFSGGNAHNHWAARLGGIVPGMPARLFDSGGDWPSGTVGVNLSGRTEHVATGSSMDKVAELLAAIRKDLRDLADAVRSVGPDVGQQINGATANALHRGRAK